VDEDLHLCPLLIRNTREPGILDDPPIQEFHDIEWRPYHSFILAETVRFWYWYIRLFQCVNYPVLPLDLVRGLREKLARRLLAHDVFVAIVIGELVRWI